MMAILELEGEVLRVDSVPLQTAYLAAQLPFTERFLHWHSLFRMLGHELQKAHTGQHLMDPLFRQHPNVFA